jgi:hypothetical protein
LKEISRKQDGYKKMKSHLRAALAALFFISLASCARRHLSDDIIPPVTSPLSRPVIGYGVISSSYTHVLDKRGDDGTALGLLRRGSVVEILERRPVLRGDKAESWVFASGNFSGWLKEEEVRVYSSRAQAETDSGMLRQ